MNSQKETPQPNRQPAASRILFLLPFPPRLDASHGGSRVIAQLLTEMAPKHEVGLLYLRAPGEAPIEDSLRKQCAVVEEVPRMDLTPAWWRQGRALLSVLGGKPLWALDWSVPTYAERLQSLAREWQPDIVQIEFAIMGQYLPALADCPAPCLLVQHDPGTKRAQEVCRFSKDQGRWMPYLDLLAWDRFERSIFRKVQAVVVFTERDRQVVAPQAGKTPLVKITPGTFLPSQALNPVGAEAGGLLFVGNFIHPPNVDAALRLIQDILPRLKEQDSGITLRIVGDHAPEKLKRLAGDDVIITGYVPDVIPYLDRAELVVAPLRLGGGARVKILEALAAGKAVVATPLAAEGLEVTDREQIVFAESDDEFCRCILDLLGDPDKRRGLASRARSWSLEHLTWGKSVSAYEALYIHLLECAKKP